MYKYLKFNRTLFCAFFLPGAAALLKMHALSGSCVTLPQHPDAYKAWFEDNLRMCIEYMEKVVQIRKTLLSFVPLKVTPLTLPIHICILFMSTII